MYGKTFDTALQDVKASGIESKDNNDAWNQFLQEAKLDNMGYTLGEVEGSGKNRKFNYTDSKGNEDTFTMDQMESLIATAQAMEQLNLATDNLINVFSKLSTEGADFIA